MHIIIRRVFRQSESQGNDEFHLAKQDNIQKWNDTGLYHEVEDAGYEPTIVKLVGVNRKREGWQIGSESRISC